MYIYQDGKLYVQDGGHLIGVDITPDGVTKIKGTETKLADNHEVCSKYEVRCRFGLDENPYIFPRETEVKHESVDNTQKPTRKYTRK